MIMLRFYSKIFQGFRYVLLVWHKSNAVKDQAFQQSSRPSPQDIMATLLGDAYRGSGVLINLMGVGAIFCAIVPLAISELASSILFFGIAEVVLMGLILLVLRDVRKLKQRWLDSRRLAEVERYSQIQDSTSGSIDSMRLATYQLLGGQDCQIRYNFLKQQQYHLMEISSERVGLVGFGICLIAAATHLIVHFEWLILFTAFLPAVVGALHGINAFLQLGALSDEHRKMGERLNEIRSALEIAFDNDDLITAKAIVFDLYELLIVRHTEWRDVALRINVRAH